MDKLKTVDLSSIIWKHIREDGLELDYAVTIPEHISNELLKELEETLEYFTGELSQVRVFGKVYPLPRQQVAYGDPGITYTYSGTTVPALPWPAPVLALKDFLFALKGIKYDFVLVNKYRNGNDHMGEHRDNEPELDPRYPIASISLGQERDFILKHKDARKPGKDKKQKPTVKLSLEHGSILFMNPPTNEVWYHSLPASSLSQLPYKKRFYETDTNFDGDYICLTLPHSFSFFDDRSSVRETRRQHLKYCNK